MAACGGQMSNMELFQQVALLSWLSSQSEEDRGLLAALTRVRVAKDLLGRLTGQDLVDAYKRTHSAVETHTPLWSVMTLERKAHVPAYDVLAVRSLWEVRVKKHCQRQKKEQERKERSALTKIEQQWQYRIYCKTHERNLLNIYLNTSTPHTHAAERPCGEDPEVRQSEGCGPDVNDDDDDDDKKLVFQLNGDQWKDFPRELQWMTYLREWHVTGTKIQKLPDYLSSFTLLAVLDMPKNALKELPPDIGKLSGLRELNVSYNRLCGVPPQLGDCQNLERLELSGNSNLCQLPFELSALKKLRHLDVAQNNFASIPVCALRMSNLQLLDLSHNRLSDLPQDMDRLQRLQTLLVHQNKLTYLPHCLTNIPTLNMIVVSGEELVCIPTLLCSNPCIKFIRLYDSPASDKKEDDEEEKHVRRWWRGQQEEEDLMKDSSEKEFIEVYVDTLKDREDVPYATTKVSISCLL
ncbi:leucine-rich repeat-containing protein 2 [Dunckerocampus dactyliophorus]|uniref:leucine-rich repeat-containing protein 2 n=1 Tax=Dunckerocampus dactyliophorus TaxID=161453 RepID=UPI0024076719|nr:leucine-rich repeat-containing protein 2 [Dunckerocampus dactyliophorus]